MGAAVAGAAVARALVAESADVVVSEAQRPSDVPSIDALRAEGIDVRAGGNEREHLLGATLVVASPGVPPSAEVFAWAREMGVPVCGELEIGARLAEVPYLAVTGTNGKTTTTGMLAACLRAAGIDAIACGNIGHPFPTAALEGHEALVVECSSFQLALQESFRPRVSALLNLAPDHLDWHGTFDRYVSAKASIYRRQSSGDVHVGNRDDAAAARVSGAAPCRVTWFTLHEPGPGQVGYVGPDLVSALDGAATIGPVGDARTGYRANAAAAAAAAIAYGVPLDAIPVGIDGYEPPPHRGDLVAEVDGVRFVDDSKATNVHAAMAAIDRVEDAVLIAGGRAKGVDLSPLLGHASRLRGVVAVGEAAPELVRLFEATVPVATAGSIEGAVRAAFEMASPGSTVLLAPACASWDQFRDYVERGERFGAAARALERTVTRG